MKPKSQIQQQYGSIQYIWFQEYKPSASVRGSDVLHKMVGMEMPKPYPHYELNMGPLCQRLSWYLFACKGTHIH